MTIKAVITSEAKCKQGCLGASTFRRPCVRLEVELFGHGSRGTSAWSGETNFNDYVGTVAADDAEAVLDRPSLYELAKINSDRYTVLGIDLRVDGSTTASIYAIDRVEHRISLNGSDIVELGESWVRFLWWRKTVDKLINKKGKRS